MLVAALIGQNAARSREKLKFASICRRDICLIRQVNETAAFGITLELRLFLAESDGMPPYELRPLIVATLLLAAALAVRGVPAGERSQTFQDICEQLLSLEPDATTPAYSPCMPPP